MMDDELKAKLREILFDARQYDYDADGNKVPEQSDDFYIAQIDQAYRDAGYERRGHHTVKLPGEDAQLLMTGQKWLSRFNDELKHLVSRGDGETWMGWDCGEVREAAKRAAGIDHE